MLRMLIVVPWLIVWLIVSARVLRAADVGELRFNRDIRPILSEHCFACHGPDSASRKADLRLDHAEGAQHVVVGGDPDNSELIRRIVSDNAEERMPPVGHGKTLSEAEKATLSQWVREGAPWEPHWAFVRPVRPPLPQTDEAQGARQRAQNAIDLFVWRASADAGLASNEREEPYRLLRRVALDLTGLPPSDELLDLYERVCRDHRNPGASGGNIADLAAYECAVDHLLASPHAAEHQARFWLDAARYGDTHGMHVDNYREMWPYRDWIIRAFQGNMPYDQFVIEQLAGDLLPNPTTDQLVATGFNRCNITTSEGGAIAAEFDARYMVDRVETASTVFLGLTAGCAVCHDHKYDPLTQRDFYQLGAFFNNTTQPAMDGNQKDTPPALALPGDEFRAEWAAIRGQRTELMDSLTRCDDDATEDWEHRASAAFDPVANAEQLVWLSLTEADASRFPLPNGARWADDHPFGRRGVRYHEPREQTADMPRLRSDEPLSISFWYHSPEQIVGNELLEQLEQTEDKKSLGWRVAVGTEGDVTFSMLDGQGRHISGRLPDNDALRPNAWQHICIRYSGGQSSSSISIFSGGRKIHLRGESEALIDAVDLAKVPLKIGKDLRTAGLSDLRIFRRWLSDEEIELLANDGELRRLAASHESFQELPVSAQNTWRSYSRNVLRAPYREANLRLSATTRRFDFIYSRSTTTLITHERSTPPRARVLARGDYAQPGEQVEPSVPASLPPLPPGAPRNRLGLARWLVSPEHPLTSRVMVNRMWLSLFGAGLVKTAEDFGVMGARPSHPELLDWLAVEFQESGWDMRHMLRLMVTSAVYQQSARLTPEKIGHDPDNTWLTRGPRLRLDAEALRDQALAVSGLLVPKLGGPSARPYQPAGLWEVVALVGSNTSKFEQDHGEGLYRRSVYTFWKRTSPPPSMAAFNAPTREQCTVRRERTNTPLQALVTMNDPQFVEAARSLAAVAMKRCSSDQERATHILRAILRRPAEQREVVELVSDAHAYRDRFSARPDAARSLVRIGEIAVDDALGPIEWASWTMIANTVLNRDDVISK